MPHRPMHVQLDLAKTKIMRQQRANNAYREAIERLQSENKKLKEAVESMLLCPLIEMHLHHCSACIAGPYVPGKFLVTAESCRCPSNVQRAQRAVAELYPCMGNEEES